MSECATSPDVSNAVGKEGRSPSAPRWRRTGDWAACVDSVNELIGDLVRPSTEVARVIGAVAKGDLSQTMALEVDGRSLKGEFLHTARVVNTMVDAVEFLRHRSDARGARSRHRRQARRPGRASRASAACGRI